MIVTSNLGASAAIDAAMLVQARVDVVQATRDRLSRMIVREGEAIGAFIRPQSIWFSEREENEPVRLSIIDARWCPNPEEGVEFRGGPIDGEVRAIPRDPRANGRPPQTLMIARAPVFVPEQAGPVYPTTGDLYRRAGVDSAADRWVYEYAG